MAAQARQMARLRQPAPGSTVQAVAQCVRKGKKFEGEDLRRLQAIAERMGIDPAQLNFYDAEGRGNNASGNDVSIEGSLLRGKDEDQLNFTVGHELSHYKTFDTRFGGSEQLPLGSMTAAMLGASGLATLSLGPLGGLLGGVLGGAAGFAGEMAAGGGYLNAAVTGVSAASLLSLGPLGAFVGGPVGGLVGTLLAAGLSLPLISKLFEIKADLHSAKNVGAEGGIKRFDDEMREHSSDAQAGQTPGNALLDPLHPPLSFRKQYLGWFQSLVGKKDEAKTD
ncbi:hypothetical protein [Paucibacter sp. M5-1]|uniref:hypothetical protein n=1 Tax=Paucibacter sp. M5-1 TaxID=3015998 RepID=UPI0022B85DE9|nr:hypothetical protein [Paucibacter sp. M5-1]MCZ7882753.1 hypothetical protein [Paucibacter sp. M5-1]